MTEPFWLTYDYTCACGFCQAEKARQGREIGHVFHRSVDRHIPEAGPFWNPSSLPVRRWAVVKDGTQIISQPMHLGGDAHAWAANRYGGGDVFKARAAGYEAREITIDLVRSKPTMEKTTHGFGSGCDCDMCREHRAELAMQALVADAEKDAAHERMVEGMLLENDR